MKKNATRGFTLVEIMIVVVIIGLLAVMAVPTWHKVRHTAQDKTITNNLRQLYGAAQQYFHERGTSTVAYDSLVGTETDKYLRAVQIVRGEAYPATFDSMDTAVTAASSDGDVTFAP